jgi:hypothetical protein
MTQVLVFRFQVDPEGKCVLGKREGFEAGEKDCHNVHCAVSYRCHAGISKSLKRAQQLGEFYGKAGQGEKP